jgi:hypothetical protein
MLIADLYTPLIGLLPAGEMSLPFGKTCRRRVRIGQNKIKKLAIGSLELGEPPVTSVFLRALSVLIPNKRGDSR